MLVSNIHIFGPWANRLLACFTTISEVQIVTFKARWPRLYRHKLLIRQGFVTEGTAQVSRMPVFLDSLRVLTNIDQLCKNTIKSLINMFFIFKKVIKKERWVLWYKLIIFSFINNVFLLITCWNRKQQNKALVTCMSWMDNIKRIFKYSLDNNYGIMKKIKYFPTIYLLTASTSWLIFFWPMSATVKRSFLVTVNKICQKLAIFLTNKTSDMPTVISFCSFCKDSHFSSINSFLAFWTSGCFW